MFDGGNLLSTNYVENMPYSNNQITNTNAFGANSRYFTRKYAGLFAFAAENVDAQWFKSYSNYGTDGQGSGVARTFSYNGYLCFNVRVWGTGDSSVNKMIVVKEQAGVTRTEDTSTHVGYIQANGIANNARVYYYLFSSLRGREVNDAESEAIFHAIVD
jgi:hypothetical protein